VNQASLLCAHRGDHPIRHTRPCQFLQVGRREGKTAGLVRDHLQDVIFRDVAFYQANDEVISQTMPVWLRSVSPARAGLG
jgi:hypothetical protein